MRLRKIGRRRSSTTISASAPKRSTSAPPLSRPIIRAQRSTFRKSKPESISSSAHKEYLSSETRKRSEWRPPFAVSFALFSRFFLYALCSPGSVAHFDFGRRHDRRPARDFGVDASTKLGRSAGDRRHELPRKLGADIVRTDCITDKTANARGHGIGNLSRRD